MLLKDTFTMQVMKRDNDGNDLKPLNTQLKINASLAFGGCTLLDSKGCWSENGKIFIDDSYRLIVNFNSDKDTINHLLELIKMELIGGRQEAVCFTVNGVTSISYSTDEAQNDLNSIFGLNAKKVLTK